MHACLTCTTQVTCRLSCGRTDVELRDLHFHERIGEEGECPVRKGVLCHHGACSHGWLILPSPRFSPLPFPTTPPPPRPTLSQQPALQPFPSPQLPASVLPQHLRHPPPRPAVLTRPTPIAPITPPCSPTILPRLSPSRGPLALLRRPRGQAGDIPSRGVLVQGPARGDPSGCGLHAGGHRACRRAGGCRGRQHRRRHSEGPAGSAAWGRGRTGSGG